MSVPRGLKALIALILLAGAVLAAAHRDPWDPDETRYLQITREMIEDGNVWLPHLGGEPYSDKPPLFFWLLIPFVALLGADSAVAGMMPSLLAFIGLLIATARLGRVSGIEPRAVEWGVIMLGSSLLPAILLGGCRMDLLLALWCTLALEQLIAGARPSSSPRHHWLLWLWIGLGVLTKGPVALALPLIAAIALATEDRRALRLFVRGPGILLALGMVAVWLIPAGIVAGPEWLETILLHQTAGRLTESFAHQEPWWYHLATVPLTLLPWSILIPPAAAAALSRRQALPAPGRLIAIYPLVTVLFLSLLSGKTFLYPLPMFAPACLIGAWWLLRDPGRWSRRAALAAAGLMAAALGVALWIVVAPHDDMSLGPIQTAVLSLSIGIPGLVAVAAGASGRLRSAAISLALAVPLLVGIGLQPVIAGFNDLLSLRPFGRALTAARQQAPGPVAAYGKLQPGYLLFSDEPLELLENPPRLRQVLDQRGVVAINSKDASRLQDELDLPWKVLAEVPYRHSTILLVTGSQ